MPSAVRSAPSWPRAALVVLLLCTGGARAMEAPRKTELKFAWPTGGKADDGLEALKRKDSPCLACHQSALLPGGPVIIGLGNNFTDHYLTAGTDAPEQAEGSLGERALHSVERAYRGDTIFVNPAFQVAAVFFAYIDPKLFALRKPDLALLPGNTKAAPSRVPPWWRVSQKGASFYIGSGIGDRTGHMMFTELLKESVFGTVEEVHQEIAKLEKSHSLSTEAATKEVVAMLTEGLKKSHGSTFKDIAAYIQSIPAPKYDGKIDGKLAGEGEKLFKDKHCADCHTTKPEHSWQIAQSVVGTDPALCNTPGNRAVDADWVNASPLHTQLGAVGGKLECGYIAPPLVGIWAAAPYFHNGSVPTLEGVLDSSVRPAKWAYAKDGKPEKRVYDHVHVGWEVEKNPTCDARYVYDTSKAGYSNAGHHFGDTLKGPERAALLEYLKTL